MGRIDERARPFLDKERALAEYLAQEGREVISLPESGPYRGGDALVDGVEVEFKKLDPGATDTTIRNVINNSIRRGGQARNIIIDTRDSGLTLEQARLGLARARNITRGRVDRVRIVGDDFDTTSETFE